MTDRYISHMCIMEPTQLCLLALLGIHRDVSVGIFYSPEGVIYEDPSDPTPEHKADPSTLTARGSTLDVRF